LGQSTELLYVVRPRKKGWRWLTESTVTRILELNQKGATNTEIAKELHITQQRVAYWLSRGGRTWARKDRTNPVTLILKHCGQGAGLKGGCRLSIYSGGSMVLKVCPKHVGIYERKLRQIIERLMEVSNVNLGLQMDTRPLEAAA
jgi:hypothetical protein